MLLINQIDRSSVADLTNITLKKLSHVYKDLKKMNPNAIL